jgi:hypothetical protein
MVEDLLKFDVAQVKDQGDTINLFKQTIANGNSSSAPITIKVKEPKPYDGSHDSQ